MNRYKFLFFIFLLPIASKAFVADTAKKVYASDAVRWLTLSDLHADTLTFHRLDTTADFFQNFNLIHRNLNDNARLYLGNLGLATHPLVFQESISWGFDLGRHAFDPYMKKIEDIKFYRTISPYTNFYYIWNRRKEQYFELTFSQNIGPRFNYAANFTRLVSQGDYNRQDADHLNYDLNTWYTSKNRKYQLFTAIINSSLVLQENGGIKNDSIFRVSSGLNSEFEPVFLNNASNRVDDKHYFIKQSYAFGPQDTLKIDTFRLARILPRFRVFHELRYNVRKNEYRETPLDSGLYNTIYFDSLNTSDVITLKHLQTRLGGEMYSKSRRSKRLNYTTYYLRLDAISIANMNFDSTLKGISLFFERNYQLSKNLEFRLSLSNGLMGNFDDNRVFQLQLRLYSRGDSNYVLINYHNRSNDPSITSERYSSNHYQWYNNFTNIYSNTLKVGYVNGIRKFSTTLSVANIENEVYFDSSMKARQLPSYNYVRWQVQKTFSVGKFHLYNQVNVQGSDQSNFIRMPLLHTYQSLYFQSYVFKKALNLRTGFDVRYYTKTKSYDYDPATSQFYLSNKSIGDYPILDFFITASLKRAVLMLKIDHLNQGFWNKGYYMVDGYPLPDRALKVGLRWAFYD